MNVSLPLNGFKSFSQLNIVFKFAGPVVKLLLHICDVMFCGKYVIKILICLPENFMEFYRPRIQES